MLRTDQLAYVVLELLMAALAVAGNVLVCWAVCINSNLQSITNFFVVSLAVADIAVGLLAIPFAITISTGFCANFYGCLFMACFVLVLTQSSIFSLLAIAVDRYIAIKNPLRYNSLVTGARAKAIITLCWVLSTGIGLTPLLGWNTGWNSTTPAFTPTSLSSTPLSSTPLSSTPLSPTPLSSPSSSRERCPKDTTECLFERVVTLDYMVYFNFFGCVLLPLLVMLVIYAHIFMAARRQLRLIGLKVSQAPAALSAPPSGSPRSTLQKEVHAAKSLAIIVGMFAFCWLPVHIINCFNHLCSHCSRPPLWLMNTAIILSHANSVVNPFIYAYRIREFRQTFRRILYQHILGRGDLQGPGDGDCRGVGSSRSSIVAPSSSSHNSKDSSCGTVTILEAAMKQANREASLCWTLDSAHGGFRPNGHHVNRSALSGGQQPPPPCMMGYAAQGGDKELDERLGGSCITYVNVHALSLNRTDSVHHAE